MTSTTSPSALTTLITSTSPTTSPSPSSSNPTTTTPPSPNLNLNPNLNPKTSALTLQVLHNLQHQHLWTSLQVHELPSTVPAAAAASTESDSPNQINLISGIPPHRLYTHPDEQFYLLERGLREEDLELERMFVLPTVQGHTWSLRRLAGVFDALPGLEDSGDGEGEDDDRTNSSSKADKLKEYYAYRKQARVTREWGGKRMLLAMVDRQMGGDSTVVYYVVQDGAVKPRQN
ncbi:hypothetical protein BO86DRAFT_358702 [Aspergillus japonicus CBS 114.51]|uniref:tRNA-splicing endonuclease subunit Sen15 domain-containing protein n=1 Tax=Aspergillus japonicus CBS 114.51 TaxID=1448312 RepID=A0A8T8X5V4_ASPJA|nr:hypothetical protein BO86DRAFT_358702 [Aspergillus japonicus CBS 114.51]RAH83543.1 hypothetical protein BO86DRAFT_358702 [Aspergillus japonicus CBS 114.51]